ncbi:MAG: amidase family protein [Paracoccaceae bacterium]|nr:amidase family protein [Paracoccaceae bacterium]
MAAEPLAFSGPEFCQLSARDVVALLKAGKVSSAELVEASLTRISQTSPAINAMVTPCPDRARETAAKADPDSLLAGLPIGIKDLTPVAGVRTTWGTKAFAEFIPDTSDPLVERLEARGGVVVGKTNTPEMGAGANTFNAVFGMTRNPWNTAMNAAGSSGGAAAGLATGEVWLSHGSDLGGSLRTPASFCGIVGLRPSPGVAGGGPAKEGFDPMPVQGPMARNVPDCALMLDAMAGFDPVWPISRPAPESPYLTTCLADPGAFRIAFSADLDGLGPVTPEMDSALRNGLSQIDIPGCEIVEDTPEIDGLESCFRTLRALGFWAGARQTPDEVTRHFKPTLQQNIAEGRALQVDDIATALTTRSQLYDSMRGFFQRYDVLACPVSGIGPLPVEIEYPPEINGIPSRDYLDWLRFAFLATVCSLPALSLPIGFDAKGMPVGVQLIGPPRGEGRLLQIARVIEESLALPLGPIDPRG